MIPTEYLRQVPVKRWLPVVVDFWSVIFGKMMKHVSTEPLCNLKTTGYKTQRAWFTKPHCLTDTDLTPHAKTMLSTGQEVEGFEWIDLPIVEGVCSV